MLNLLKNIYIDSEHAGGEVRVDGGKVILSSLKSCSYVTLEFDYNPSAGSLIYGDAWERSYADLSWKSPYYSREAQYPWYINVINADKSVFTGFGVKTMPNALCSWYFDNGSLWLKADIRCGTEPKKANTSEAFEVCELVYTEKNITPPEIFSAMREFCAIMCDHPLMPAEPIYGGNNAYYAIGRSSYAETMADAANIAKWSYGNKARPFMVLDACWQPFMLNDDFCSGGPYPHGSYLFPDMRGLASGMKDLGVRPGLWYRPLKTVETLPDGYFLHKFILDPTVLAVQELLEADTRRFTAEWGFELIKHDFSTYDLTGTWGKFMTKGVCYPESHKSFFFCDRTKSTAQAIKLLYASILKGAGSAYVMGCNTMSHLAAGCTHIQRIGDDTSGADFSITKSMGVNTLAFRLAQHGAFYSADADCVGITEKIPWELNKAWLNLVAASGTPLFVCADPKSMTPKIETDITTAFKAVCGNGAAEPLDWFENITPNKWLADGEELEFSWE